MKFAFDVDGVITVYPEMFSILTNALVQAGHEVYIMTDYDEYYRAQREQELQEYGIAYTELLITGHKEDMCRQRQIDYLLDDDREYFNAVQPLTIHIGKMSQDGIPDERA